MATTPVGQEIHFEIDRTRTFPEAFTAPSSWGVDDQMYQVRAVMKNIVNSENAKAIDGDGEHVVPFWASPALKKAFKQSKAKKWIKLAYYRESEEEERADRTVTLNTANFEILD